MTKSSLLIRFFLLCISGCFSLQVLDDISRGPSSPPACLPRCPDDGRWLHQTRGIALAVGHAGAPGHARWDVGLRLGPWRHALAEPHGGPGVSAQEEASDHFDQRGDVPVGLRAHDGAATRGPKPQCAASRLLLPWIHRDPLLPHLATQPF